MNNKGNTPSSIKGTPPVAVITGASSGIGRATAIKLAAEGTDVVLVARRKEKLEDVAAEITASGGNALVVPADVSDRQQVEEAVRYIEEKKGRINVLVNNAGYGVYGSAEECSIEDYESQIKVNYLGAVLFTKNVIPVMRRTGSGSIIIVSSICGRTILPLYSGYCASKYALNAFTNILRKELSDSGIGVSLICPGATESEFENVVVQRRRRNIKRIFPVVTSEKVADAIIKCIRSPKREVIIPRIRILHILLLFFFPKIYEWYYWKIRAQK